MCPSFYEAARARGAPLRVLFSQVRGRDAGLFMLWDREIFLFYGLKVHTGIGGKEVEMSWRQVLGAMCWTTEGGGTGAGEMWVPCQLDKPWMLLIFSSRACCRRS